jgi:hypothetical protein
MRSFTVVDVKEGDALTCKHTWLTTVKGPIEQTFVSACSLKGMQKIYETGYFSSHQ